MQKQREVQVTGHLQDIRKTFLLVFPGRKHPVIIKSGFSQRHDALAVTANQGFQLAAVIIIPSVGIVGMDTAGTPGFLRHLLPYIVNRCLV